MWHGVWCVCMLPLCVCVCVWCGMCVGRYGMGIHWFRNILKLMDSFGHNLMAHGQDQAICMEHFSSMMKCTKRLGWMSFWLAELEKISSSMHFPTNTKQKPGKGTRPFSPLSWSRVLALTWSDLFSYDCIICVHSSCLTGMCWSSLCMTSVYYDQWGFHSVWLVLVVDTL